MKKWIFGIFYSLIILILTTSIVLAYFNVSDTLYKRDMEKYEISEYTGLSEEEILANYNAVLKYLSPFNKEDEFSLPTLAFSESGAQHFYETKNIFKGVYILGTISFFIGLIIILKKGIKKEEILISSAFTLIIPLAILTVVALNFNRAFILFHKIFFRNEMWVFDPMKDPIIDILPEAFFMHCAIVIGLAWVLMAVVQFLAYLKKAKE